MKELTPQEKTITCCCIRVEILELEKQQSEWEKALPNDIASDNIDHLAQTIGFLKNIINKIEEM